MKTKLKKWGAVLCAVLTLSITFTSIPVYAESVGSLEKTLDLVLVKLGVVCNENGLNTIANNLYDTAIGNVQDFDDYCTSNGLDSSDSTSYDSWKETREYQDHLLDMVMENKYRIATENGEDVTLDFTMDDMNNAIHGGDGVRRGEEYTIDADTVDQVHNVFQNWWSENSEYYIYRIPSITEIPVSYFGSESHRDNVINWVKYLENTYEFVYVSMYSGSTQFSVNVGESGFLLCTDSSNFPTSYVYLYNDDWFQTGFGNGRVGANVSNITTSYTPENTTFYTNGSVNYLYLFDQATSKFQGVVGSVSHNEKIWKSVETYKAYDCGQQIVYFSPSYTTNTVTTVSYTGDYYCDNSNVYSYSVVQDDVNNIQGDLTDSIVDSTVDQSVTNITNNYYYTSGSGGGTTDGDTSTDSDNPFDGILEKLMDAVGNIVGLLDDVVALLLSFIADALNAVVSMVTSVVNMLTEFKEELSGLTGALGEFFPYLPEDFWTIIMGTVSVICGLAIISYFKNK